MATKTTLKVLPQGHRIIETSHGNYIQKQKRRVKQYKTSKKHRDAIKRGLRRIYFPLLTGTAVGIPLGTAINHAGRIQNVFTAQGFRKFGSSLIASYTGFYPLDGSFKIGRMAQGLLPLLAVMLIKRTGIFKGVNTQLARLRIPLRLN